MSPFECAVEAADKLIREAQPIYDWDAEEIVRAAILAMASELTRYRVSYPPTLGGAVKDEDGSFVRWSDLTPI